MKSIVWQTPDPSKSAATESTAIVFATFSLLIAIIICPSLSWHASNRNVGATVLVAATIYANFQNFLNAVIWSNDNVEVWYSGVGLCDLEIRIQIMLQSLYLAAISCILRALARALDTDRATWSQTKAQRRRSYAIDLVCCLGIPSIQMITLYIVQPFRYWIYGISGCVVPGDLSWLRVVLMLLPPLLWTLFCVYLSSKAVLILVRLLRYRMNFNSVLRNAQTTKSRFFRLYALCILSILGNLPIQIWLLVLNIGAGVTSYSWDDVHNPTLWDWNTAVKMPANGTIIFDRYIWMAGGILIFLLFGFGRDAVKMYRDGLLAIGLGRIFPSLHPDRKSSIVASVTSMGSKAKMLFSNRSSASTSPTFNKGSVLSTSTTDSEYSPRKATFLETIREGHRESRQTTLPMNQQSTNDSKGWKYLPSYFRKPSPSKQPSASDDHFILTQVSGNREARIQSNVTAEPESPTMTSHIRSFSRGEADVLVRKEIRQASETETTLPMKVYHGV
ncbi:mating-type factor pheromone receptor [Pseudocercospora fijiensis CIRAD86]|uniref:Mating-type factor pheromone receptor n=1 Tax=Pseudocercospora fijiensis (strain CIRAD86) TaxID=383855 RepID=M3ADA0_PSEFD|nr:mating-type factor pheromone receptor [Pseudocercospora fijiensis CIRAD86]EME82526.1 mating-type factor pheromone receptor [Pseudocercospora fijiensis CIRAD86]